MRSRSGNENQNVFLTEFRQLSDGKRRYTKTKSLLPRQVSSRMATAFVPTANSGTIVVHIDDVVIVVEVVLVVVVLLVVVTLSQTGMQ